METNKDSRRKGQEDKVDSPHGPTDHNPYPYPLQKPNRKGWLRALLVLIAVAVIITVVSLVVGIYDHHEESIHGETPVENVVLEP